MLLEEMIHDENHPLSAIKSLLSDNPEKIPNLMFVGPPGTGKTTTAHAIAQHLDADIYEFNASDERGIDFIRTRVKEIAHQRGYGVSNIILLDEADGLTRQAQDALRRIIETSSALFILTANEEPNITPALHSRCVKFVFRPYNDREMGMLLSSKYPNITEGQCVLLTHAYNGDIRRTTLAMQRCRSLHDLLILAGSEEGLYSSPALSIVGGDWENLRMELHNIPESTSTLSLLARLHGKVRQLDMEAARFHHYSRVWGDAILAAHQWPLGREGFIDWFVGSLASQWDLREERI